MNLTKKADRILNASSAIKTYKRLGMTHKNLGEFCKWKDLRDGGRMQVKMIVHQMSGDKELIGAERIWFLEDSLGRVACQMQTDKAEVTNWLKEHGYKPVKQWYMEDYGMSEETWNEWNGINTEEE